MKKTTRNAIDYMMAALLIIFSVWLLIQPISAYADSIENVEATKAPKGTHGWIYNKKTKKPVSSSVILGKIGKSSFETERDIMEFLDMKYVSPKKRNTITINKI